MGLGTTYYVWPSNNYVALGYGAPIATVKFTSGPTYKSMFKEMGLFLDENTGQISFGFYIMRCCFVFLILTISASKSFLDFKELRKRLEYKLREILRMKLQSDWPVFTGLDFLTVSV